MVQRGRVQSFELIQGQHIQNGVGLVGVVVLSVVIGDDCG